VRGVLRLFRDDDSEVGEPRPWKLPASRIIVPQEVFTYTVLEVLLADVLEATHYRTEFSWNNVSCP
jgi:hypothetical protein